MARVQGTILSGRSGRHSRSQHYFLGHCKVLGRRMSSKVMAPELFPYQQPRGGTTLPTKTEIGRRQQAHALKGRARAIEARLQFLKTQIREIEQAFDGLRKKGK